MIEKLFAGIVLAVCLLLLLRLVIGPQRRYRLDGFALRSWQGLRRRVLALWQGLRRGVLALWQGPRKRREAKALAEDAIRRASQGQWDGNVYTPDRFKRPPRDKLH